MNNSESLEQLLNNEEASESEIWDSLTQFNEDDAMSFALVDSLLDHPNCSDRIVAYYFSYDLPIDEDTWSDRGDRLSDQFFWADIQIVLPRTYISLQTRTLIGRQVVGTLAEMSSDLMETDGNSLESLIYFTLILPDGLVITPDPSEPENIRQDYLTTLSDILQRVQELENSITHWDNKHEDPEDNGRFEHRVEALAEWKPAITVVLEASI